MKKICVSILCVLLTLCIALSAALVLRVREDRRDEKLYMKRMFSAFNDILLESKTLARSEIVPEKRAEGFIYLHCALRNAAEEIEDGYRFVSEKVPGVTALWFDAKAAEISAGMPDFLTGAGELTPQGRAFLNDLNTEMNTLLDPLLGADGLNLNEALDIHEFAVVLSTFYSSRS